MDSLLNQTYENIHVIIRDDGSDDSTVETICEYTRKYSNKFSIIINDSECKSPTRNFFELLKYASADYVMFCDQDDVWLPEKVERSLETMMAEEKLYGRKVPHLVASGMAVVDENLRPIPGSKMCINPNRLKPNHLLVQNEIPGCTMMCNRALYKNLGTPTLDAVLMHDWWIALFASMYGHISVIPDQLILYRQHSNNVVGAVNINGLHYAYKKLMDKKTKRSYEALWRQAEAFLIQYKGLGDDSVQAVLERFCKMQQKNKIQKIYQTLRFRYTKSGFLRLIGQLYFV